MNYTCPEVLSNALKAQNLQIAKRCVLAGQNPMQLPKRQGSNFGFAEASVFSYRVRPKLLSLLALRDLIDLNEIFIPPGISWYSMSLLGGAVLYPKNLHLLLQAGVKLDVPYTTNPKESQKSIFCAYHFLPDASALMLLFAGANPKEKIFNANARPQVRVWLSGFLKAKELFEDIFDDPDLEALLFSFIFEEEYLRNALGE